MGGGRPRQQRERVRPPVPGAATLSFLRGMASGSGSAPLDGGGTAAAAPAGPGGPGGGGGSSRGFYSTTRSAAGDKGGRGGRRGGGAGRRGAPPEGSNPPLAAPPLQPMLALPGDAEVDIAAAAQKPSSISNADSSSRVPPAGGAAAAAMVLAPPSFDLNLDDYPLPHSSSGSATHGSLLLGGGGAPLLAPSSLGDIGLLAGDTQHAAAPDLAEGQAEAAAVQAEEEVGLPHPGAPPAEERGQRGEQQPQEGGGGLGFLEKLQSSSAAVGRRGAAAVAAPPPPPEGGSRRRQKQEQQRQHLLSSSSSGSASSQDSAGNAPLQMTQKPFRRPPGAAAVAAAPPPPRPAAAKAAEGGGSSSGNGNGLVLAGLPFAGCSLQPDGEDGEEEEEECDDGEGGAAPAGRGDDVSSTPVVINTQFVPLFKFREALAEAHEQHGVGEAYHSNVAPPQNAPPPPTCVGSISDAPDAVLPVTRVGVAPPRGAGRSPSPPPPVDDTGQRLRRHSYHPRAAPVAPILRPSSGRGAKRIRFAAYPDPGCRDAEEDPVKVTPSQSQSQREEVAAEGSVLRMGASQQGVEDEDETPIRGTQVPVTQDRKISLDHSAQLGWLQQRQQQQQQHLLQDLSQPRCDTTGVDFVDVDAEEEEESDGAEAEADTTAAPGAHRHPAEAEATVGGAEQQQEQRLLQSMDLSCLQGGGGSPFGRPLLGGAAAEAAAEAEPSGEELQEADPGVGRRSQEGDGVLSERASNSGGSSSRMSGPTFSLGVGFAGLRAAAPAPLSQGPAAGRASPPVSGGLPDAGAGGVPSQHATQHGGGADAFEPSCEMSAIAGLIDRQARTVVFDNELLTPVHQGGEVEAEAEAGVSDTRSAAAGNIASTSPASSSDEGLVLLEVAKQIFERRQEMRERARACAIDVDMDSTSDVGSNEVAEGGAPPEVGGTEGEARPAATAAEAAPVVDVDEAVSTQPRLGEGASAAAAAAAQTLSPPDSLLGTAFGYATAGHSRSDAVEAPAGSAEHDDESTEDLPLAEFYHRRKVQALQRDVAGYVETRSMRRDRHQQQQQQDRGAGSPLPGPAPPAGEADAELPRAEAGSTPPTPPAAPMPSQSELDAMCEGFSMELSQDLLRPLPGNTSNNVSSQLSDATVVAVSSPSKSPVDDPVGAALQPAGGGGVPLQPHRKGSPVDGDEDDDEETQRVTSPPRSPARQAPLRAGAGGRAPQPRSIIADGDDDDDDEATQRVTSPPRSPARQTSRGSTPQPRSIVEVLTPPTSSRPVPPPLPPLGGDAAGGSAKQAKKGTARAKGSAGAAQEGSAKAAASRKRVRGGAAATPADTATAASSERPAGAKRRRGGAADAAKARGGGVGPAAGESGQATPSDNDILHLSSLPGAGGARVVDAPAAGGRELGPKGRPRVRQLRGAAGVPMKRGGGGDAPTPAAAIPAGDNNTAGSSMDADLLAKSSAGSLGSLASSAGHTPAAAAVPPSAPDGCSPVWSDPSPPAPPGLSGATPTPDPEANAPQRTLRPAKRQRRAANGTAAPTSSAPSRTAFTPLFATYSVDPSEAAPVAVVADPPSEVTPPRRLRAAPQQTRCAEHNGDDSEETETVSSLRAAPPAAPRRSRGGAAPPGRSKKRKSTAQWVDADDATASSGEGGGGGAGAARIPAGPAVGRKRKARGGVGGAVRQGCALCRVDTDDPEQLTRLGERMTGRHGASHPEVIRRGVGQQSQAPVGGQSDDVLFFHSHCLRYAKVSLGNKQSLTHRLQAAAAQPCTACMEPGATVKCTAHGCLKTYHLPCALLTPNVSLHNSKGELRCPDHS